jgi:elongation factor Ts
MAVNIEDVKRLKNLTGVGLTDAKRALEETDGDYDAALEAMRKKGLTKAEKRGEREARAGVIGTYNHDNRIGVLVEVNCETDFVARNDLFKDLVKDLSMHIAAMNPAYLNQESIPEEDKLKIEKQFLEAAEDNKKSAEIIAKIVEGQISKYFSERCLLDQPFVKNPDQTVADLVKDHAARLGENIVVRRFERMAVGEINS